MKVILKSSYLVKPAEQTWEGLLSLSESDQTGDVCHLSTIQFYKPAASSPPSNTLISNLISSLGKVLVPFYPLAGRLRQLDGGRLELNCNAKGAQLIEAESEDSLADMGEIIPSPELDSLVPFVDYESIPLEQLPLLLVQLTRFRCGGITLSFAMSHAVLDGIGAAHFMSEWARLSRGEPLGHAPVIKHKLMRAGDPPMASFDEIHRPELDPLPLLIGESSSENERKKETTVAMLKLTKSQVEMLKTRANEGQDNTRPYTRYESLAGHIWRCMCEAHGQASEQKTALGFPVDIRKRMQPPLPDHYFGNALADMVAVGCSGDLVSRPLGYASGLIRAAIDKVTSEYANSTIDFFKTQKDLTPFQWREHDPQCFWGNPNLGLSNWMTLPLYELDFGWGKGTMIPVIHRSPGYVMILRDPDEDGSLIVAACIQVAHVAAFKKLFYQGIQDV